MVGFPKSGHNYIIIHITGSKYCSTGMCYNDITVHWRHRRHHWWSWIGAYENSDIYKMAAWLLVVMSVISLTVNLLLKKFVIIILTHLCIMMSHLDICDRASENRSSRHKHFFHFSNNQFSSISSFTASSIPTPFQRVFTEF